MLEVTFYCPVVQSYGQTNSSGEIAISFPTNNLFGHRGASESIKEHSTKLMKERAIEKNLVDFEVPTKILITSSELSSYNDVLAPTDK